MNRMRKDALTLAALVAVTALSLLAANKARADCVDGVRAATLAEVEFATPAPRRDDRGSSGAAGQYCLARQAARFH